MSKRIIGPKNKQTDTLSFFTLCIAILGIAVVPLLIRVIPTENLLTEYEWYRGDRVLIDSYSLFKSQFILVLGILSAVIIFYRQYTYKTYSLRDPIIILTLIFSIITVISFFTAVSSELASRGMNERYEGTWIWLSYISIFILIYGENWDDYKLGKIVKFFVLSNLLLSVIGVVQYFGYDPVFNNLTKWFITSSRLGTLNYNADYSINYKVIIQTLYHYNYVGFYLSLSIPFIMSFALYEKRLRNKIGYLSLLLLMFFNLLGSSARGGLVGVIFVLPLFFLFNRQLIFKNLKNLTLIILIVVMIFTGFELYSDGFISKRVMSTFTSVSPPDKLQNISIIDESLQFKLYTGDFIVNIHSRNNSDWIVDYQFNGQQIEPIVHETGNYYYFDLNNLNGLIVYPVMYESMTLLTIETYGHRWMFGFNENNKLSYFNSVGKFDKIITADAIGFEGRERLGSSRGYIWSRSIPLILKKPLLGYGVETFTIAFPQQDYIGKYNAYNTANMIIDKPHNVYLQIALNSGLIALVSYIGVIFLTEKKLVNILHRNKYHFNSPIHSALSLSIASYTIASLFNDSSVQVSTVFWVILGLMVSIQKSVNCQ